MASTSMGKTPAVWAASTRNGIPRSRQAGADLGHGQDGAQDVGGVCQHHQRGLGPDGSENVVGIGSAVAGTTDAGDLDAGLGQSGEGPGDGVVLQRRGDDVGPGGAPAAARPRPPGARAWTGDRRADNSLGCQQTFDGDVQCMGGVEREDHPRLVTDVEEIGDGAARPQQATGGLQRQFVGAAAGIGANVAEGLSYRLDHLMRLWTRSGGVVEIDHASLRAGVSRCIVPFPGGTVSATTQRRSPGRRLSLKFALYTTRLRRHKGDEGNEWALLFS